jgi:hypothetical protein
MPKWLRMVPTISEATATFTSVRMRGLAAGPSPAD